MINWLVDKKESVINEIWLNYNYNGLKYKVSNFGNIKGERFNRYLKTRLNKDRYECVTLGNNEFGRGQKRVHRLVAELFVKNDFPLLYDEINHIDCVRSNNIFSNLEWVTHKDNIKYALKHNRHVTQIRDNACENNPNTRLINSDIVKIIEKYNLSRTKSNRFKIANEYGISESAWQKIAYKTTWKNIK